MFRRPIFSALLGFLIAIIALPLPVNAEDTEQRIMNDIWSDADNAIYTIPASGGAALNPAPVTAGTSGTASCAATTTVLLAASAVAWVQVENASDVDLRFQIGAAATATSILVKARDRSGWFRTAAAVNCIRVTSDATGNYQRLVQ